MPITTFSRPPGAKIEETRAVPLKMTARSTVLAAIGSIVTSRHAYATPCQPAVILVGDNLVIAPIGEALRSRGLVVPEPGCPAEIAQVDLRDGAIVVSIVDSDGRETSRSVADPSTAATLIESFASDPLPPPHALTRPLVVSGHDNEEPRILAMDTPGSSRPSTIRGAIGIASETSIASDASIWTGVQAHACAQLGPVCAGGQARVAMDLLIGGDAEHAEATRRNGDLQLTADYLVSRDGWSVTSGVGIGVGWLHVRRDIMDALGSDRVEIDAGGLRTSAHATAELPLGRSITLTLGAAVDLAPTAHRQQFLVETRTAPGEPRWYARFQIGLEMSHR